MWYRTILAKAKDDALSDRGYEAKIIRSAAERAVRRHLRLKGNYNPTNQELHRYVKQVIEKLKQRYRNLNNVRLHAEGETISPIVEEVVGEIIK